MGRDYKQKISEKELYISNCKEAKEELKDNNN